MCQLCFKFGEFSKPSTKTLFTFASYTPLNSNLGKRGCKAAIVLQLIEKA